MTDKSLDAIENLTNNSQLWIFGYGSLIWKPNFTYSGKLIGYIKGFQRRFWQGSIVHRGTAKLPGRVATLVESPDNQEKSWGIAYHLVGKDQISGAMEHLNVRECVLGGYTSYTSEFYPRDNQEEQRKNQQQGEIEVLVYTATPNNELYMGVASVKDLANLIASTEGVCGHNVEYVIKIADFMRESLPGETDDHLFELEREIISCVRQKGLCWKSIVYGSKHKPVCKLLSQTSIPEMETSLSIGPVNTLDDFTGKVMSFTPRPDESSTTDAMSIDSDLSR